MSLPLVSVIMPAYNEELFIREAINSIIGQSYESWELLVMDDCSTDKTWEVIESFNDERIRTFRNDQNLKYQACCNLLFKEAKGAYVTFLDADDTCPSDRLEKCLDTLADQQADYLTTDHSKLYSDSGDKVLFQAKVDHSRLEADLGYYPTICCASVFAKTKLVSETGGYAKVFAGFGADDYHWVFRLSRLGKGVHLEEDLYTYRIHGDQMRNEVSPEHFVSHNLDRAIRKRLVEENVDLTQPENEQLANELKAQLLKPYHQDPTKLSRQQSIQELNHGNWKRAVSVMLNAIRTRPFKLSNWTRLAYLLYVIFRRALQGNPRP